MGWLESSMREVLKPSVLAHVELCPIRMYLKNQKICVLIIQLNFDGSNLSGPSVQVQPIHGFKLYLD